MTEIPVGVPCGFEVAFDSPSLNVGMSVFDMSSGSPVLVGSVIAMQNTGGNQYYGEFTPATVGKRYAILKAVYTDGTLTTLSSAYAQGSESARAVSAPVIQNQALPKFPFPMTDSATHLPATGLSPTVQRSIDGGAFANCTNAAAELASGSYYIDLSAADLNGKCIMLKFSATGADTRFATVVTEE